MRIIAATLTIASGTVSFSIASFMTSYGRSALHLGPDLAFLSAASLGLATVVVAPLGGWLSDRLGARITVTTSRLSLAALGWPAFAWLVHDGSVAAVLTVSAGLAALTTVGTPAALCLIADAMPASSRVTGLSFSYALGISLFGGVTQAAAVALLGWTGDPRSTAWLVVAAGVVGAAAVQVLSKAD